ncbi:flagellar basal body-associated FliL family protein [Marinovum sp.]|uniref:flagellar basal body-associated FliL family protein n=1 Tax=Marinovum sp. TaxID=2024839 RepID=UPI002B270674|nr:flagellar basal body-associated FliL family protein [Marinovum sp.]
MLRLLALLLACVIALAGGLVISVGPERLMALLPFGDAAPEVVDAAEPVAAPAEIAGENIAVTPFKEIIVNITATTATGRQTTRFLKLNIAMAYDSTLPGAANIEERKLFLRDSFQEYLRQLNESDLQGSIGLVRLKSELLRRARAITESEAPQQFLIADLIIQ